MSPRRGEAVFTLATSDDAIAFSGSVILLVQLPWCMNHSQPKKLVTRARQKQIRIALEWKQQPRTMPIVLRVAEGAGNNELKKALFNILLNEEIHTLAFATKLSNPGPKISLLSTGAKFSRLRTLSYNCLLVKARKVLTLPFGFPHS